MIICALIRGGMRYAEQYMNHNVAFRLLALFRSKTFAALRRLAPAKLSGKGKGDLIALVTTDVELLEIFFAHTISPVVIAIATTVLYTVALLTLSPAIAVTLVIAHLTVGIVLPKLFATAVGGLGGDIRRESAQLDDEMLDDMRGLDEIIRFGQGHARLAGIASRTRSLWSRRARLSAKNGDFAGFGAVLVVLFTAIAALLAMVTSGTTMPIASAASAAAATIQTVLSAPAARLTAAFVLLASSFGPTLALSALPANLTQTFAAARRLFALMDETPAVEERGDFLPRYHACPCTTSRSATAIRARLQLPEAMRMPPSHPPSQSSTTSRSTYHNTASSASKARPAAANRPAETAHALLGPAIRLSRTVRGATAADRRASSPSRANDDGTGNVPVRRHYP